MMMFREWIEGYHSLTGDFFLSLFFFLLQFLLVFSFSMNAQTATSKFGFNSPRSEGLVYP